MKLNPPCLQSIKPAGDKGVQYRSIAEATVAQRYHKASRQEGAVYPSCLDLLYQDKRKIESEYS